MTVGDPRKHHAAGVVPGVQGQGEVGDARGKEPPEEEMNRHEQGQEPEQSVQVNGRGIPGPKSVVDQMGSGRKWPPEGHL